MSTNTLVIIIFCVLLALAGSVSPALSQTTVSLEDLMAQLGLRNPDVAAAQSRYEASLSNPAEAQALPDPVVSFVTKNGSGNPIPFTQLGDDPLSSIGFMWQQEFPYPGKLKLASDMAKSESASAYADVDIARWRVMAQLREAYYGYFLADRSLKIVRESLDLLKRIETVAESRYAVGQGIQQDVFRAQLEVSVLNQRIAQLELDRADAGARINRLLGRSVDAELGEPAPLRLSVLTETIEQIDSRLADQAPRIRSADALLTRERTGLDLAKKQYRPDFMTSVEYDNSPNYPDMWEIQFGVKIPIFSRKQTKLSEGAAAANINRAERELSVTKQDVEFEVREQLLRIQTMEKMLTVHREAVIPQAQLTLESSMASYQQGKADFQQILGNFLTLLEHRIDYDEHLAEHETAVAKLEEAIGRKVSAPAPETGGEHEYEHE